MRNKMIALMLCGVMVVSTLTGCGSKDENQTKESQVTTEESQVTTEESQVTTEDSAEEDPYAEHVTIQRAGYQTDSTLDYDNELTRYYAEKFNMDMEVIDNTWDGEAERFSLQANGGTLYDMNLWLGFNFNGYYNYVDGGLFEPLPDDWTEKYPNLYEMVSDSGYLEELTVDGKIYAIPHAVYGKYLNVDVISRHSAAYIRKDLAEEVGMADLGADGTVKMSELRAFIEAVAEKELVEKPVLGASVDMVKWIFSTTKGFPVYDFYDDGDGYKYTPAMEGYAEVLQDAQDWYQDGLLDLDFYSKGDSEYREEFTAGLIPVMLDQGHPGLIWENLSTKFDAAVEGGDFGEDVILAQPVAEDGTVYTVVVDNYWLATVFKPGIDEAVLDRCLAIMDYTCSREGAIVPQLGVPEVDWTYNDDGTIKYLNEAGKSALEIYGAAWWPYFMMGYCNDDFKASEYAATGYPETKQRALDLYQMRAEGYLFNVPKDFNIMVSEKKNVYNGSVNVSQFISKAVTGTDSVEVMLADFLDENKDLWQPLLDEVNEYAGY